MVDKVALVRSYYTYLPLGAGTVGLFQVAVPWDSVSPQSHNCKKEPV